MAPRGQSSALRLTRAPAPVFAALGDGTRLLLVARLSQQGPLSVAALTAGARVSRQAVAKHLRVLERAGLARSTREGREAVWALDARLLADARTFLDTISERWDGALTRLRAFVEQPDAPAPRRPGRRGPTRASSLARR